MGGLLAATDPMTDRRLAVHTAFLLLLPVLVALFGWSTLAAVLLVLVMVLWRWVIVVSGIVAPEKTPELELETISISHFVEKVRWCMDRLGLDYVETACGATLGVFYRGRTVPQLKLRTGLVRSTLGRSNEILRYLWGRYGEQMGPAADFLKPTEARVELERRLDRYGEKLQIWVYYRILDHRQLTLHAWGVDDPAVSAWEKMLLKIVYPLQARLIRRAFRITDESFARAVAHMESLLADLESELHSNSVSLLGDAAPNYTDLAFAAMTGLWLMPPNYGDGQAAAVRIEYQRMPELAQMDIRAWRAAFPKAVRLAERLYSEYRIVGAAERTN